MCRKRNRALLSVIAWCGLPWLLAATPVRAQLAASHPKIAILFEASENASPALITKAMAPFESRVAVSTIGVTGGATALPADTNLSSYDLVIADLSSAAKVLGPAVAEAKLHTKVILVDSTDGRGNVTLSHPDWPRRYWTNLSVENLSNLIRLAESDVLHVPDQPAAPPVHYPDEAFYHPGAPGLFGTLADYLAWYEAPAQRHYGYRPDRCTVGVLFYFSYYMQQSLAAFDAALNEIEARGCNAVGLMTKGAPKLDALRMPDGRPFVDVLLYSGERINLKDFAAGTEEADRLGVPLLGLYLDYRQSREQYLGSSGGLAPGMSGALTDGERDGVFEPIMIGSRHNPHDPNAAYELLPEQIRWRVDRAIAWARLRHKPNAAKCVVFTYWSEGGGKADVGGDPDEFLNVPASLVSLLHALKASGYDLGPHRLPDRDELAKQMSRNASNVGTWAPRDLIREVKNRNVILIPENEYRVWFEALPQKLRESVIAQWGPPPGNVMVYTSRGGKKYLVIPALTFGKILIAPHPDWGYQQSQKALMSAGALPPHHQYLAFFLWLQHQWKADAWVSLFTNITLEPGKSEGPHVDDAEGVLLGGIPHIHPEMLGGSGGIANKRKALALTVGWFRGAVSAKTDVLYHGLREQARAIAAQPALGSQESSAASFRKAVSSADLGRALALDVQTAPVEDLAQAVLHYLDELSHEAMPHGSHVLGDVPTGEMLVQTVLAMLAPDINGNVRKTCPAECLDRLTRAVVLDQVAPERAVRGAVGAENRELAGLMQEAQDDAQRLRLGGREIASILDALEGRRISPGPADDPLLRSDALPAGRSLFSFDAAAIPTRQAEALGAKSADATIDAFRRGHHGEYPTKLAFVLWTSELSANGGVTEAEILNLLGVRLMRNVRGQVVDVALVPRAELKRPRVDVLVTTSGLYRDHYKDKIDLIEHAVALAEESPEADNPVRRDSDLARAELLKSTGSVQDAARLSSARVFAPAPNAYSPSIQFLAKSGDLRGDNMRMTELFTSRMDHVYGVGQDGSSSAAAFDSNLSQMQAATLSRSDQVNGLLDSSMPAAFLGGLNMAAKAVNGGHDSDLYIDTLRKGSDPQIEIASHVIERELQSKYLNPAWIKDMQASGYDGARYMSQMTDSLSLWSSTAKQSVDSGTWESVKRVYIDDQYHVGMKRYFEQNNSYARQVMLATLLDAASRGFWSATAEEKATLATQLAQSISLHGPAGTADINRNQALTSAVTQAIAGLPGSAEQMRGYRRALASAGSPKPVPEPTSIRRKLSSPAVLSSSSLVTGTILQKVNSQAEPDAKSKGRRVFLVLCLAVVGLFLVGWVRGAKEFA